MGNKGNIMSRDTFKITSIVDDFLKNATKLYIIEQIYPTGYGQSNLQTLRTSLTKQLLKNFSPVDLASVYEKLMKKVEGKIQVANVFALGNNLKAKEQWNAEAEALADITEIIRDRRYNYRNPNLFNSKTCQYYLSDPVDMVEDFCDFSTHNARIKRTDRDEHDLVVTQLVLNSHLENTVAGLSDDGKKDFASEMMASRSDYANQIENSRARLEKCKNFDFTSIPDIMQGSVRRLIQLQSDYSIDMMAKYGSKKGGLCYFVDHLDDFLSSPTMGIL